MEAILQMYKPQDKTELLRFNGTINYQGEYIPNLSSLNKPLIQYGIYYSYFILQVYKNN